MKIRNLRNHFRQCDDLFVPFEKELSFEKGSYSIANLRLTYRVSPTDYHPTAFATYNIKERQISVYERALNSLNETELRSVVAHEFFHFYDLTVLHNRYTDNWEPSMSYSCGEYNRYVNSDVEFNACGYEIYRFNMIDKGIPKYLEGRIAKYNPYNQKRLERLMQSF